MITITQLEQMFPQAKQANLALYLDALNSTMDANSINTKNRIAGFLAQCCHESGNFSAVVENLNYSSDALHTLYPKYFPSVEVADQYSRQPQKIANHMYANRMGNGDEASGEGWKFRGRGIIQITGKTNYTLCGTSLQLDLVTNPTLLETPLDATRSAGWYWTLHNINAAADADDIVHMTKIINGGTNGLDNRTKLYNQAKAVLP